ncbi:MAG: M20 family peptidase [Psychrosphaera sp.]|nr:M20 family peptidase [Psychrosphaera sp.]
MKKTLTFLIPLVALLAVIILFRTFFSFEDQQLVSTPSTIIPTIDEPLALKRLSGAIQIKTISYDDREKVDKQTFLQLHQHLQQSFPLIHQQAQKQVINQHSLVFHLAGIVASLKPELFLAHLDVVPVDNNTLSNWTHPPFSGEITDGGTSKGTIWGRGTMDDKGGLMALMEAVELMRKNNIQPNRDIYLAFGHDEEIGGLEGAAKIAQHFKQQNIEFEFVLDEGGAITQGMMQGFDRPVALVGIAEKGYVNVHLVVEADGGHASQPPKQTAVGILSQAIVNLENNPFPASLEFTQMTFDAIGNEAAFGPKLAMSNLWLTSPLIKNTLLGQSKLAASLHTTMAATMVSGSSKSNILPTQATGVVNVRIFPGETWETVKQRMISIIDDPRVKVTTTKNVNPSPVSSVDSFGFRLIAQSIRDLDDQILVAPYLVQGGTDSKYFVEVSANVYRFLMIRATRSTLKRLHGIDEQITVSEYMDTIRFYYQMLNRV